MYRYGFPSPKSRLLKTARKYMRLVGGVRTAQEWDDLCTRIAKRDGYAPITLRSVLLVGVVAREKTPLVFRYRRGDEVGRDDRPTVRVFCFQVWERYKSIKQARNDRINREWAVISDAESDVKKLNAAIRRAKSKLKEMKNENQANPLHAL